MTTNGNDLVKDPVCGMVKPRSQMKASYVYQGQTYYFCAEQDKEMFEAHPDRWLPKEKDTEGG